MNKQKTLHIRITFLIFYDSESIQNFCFIIILLFVLFLFFPIVLGLPLCVYIIAQLL